jgi:hypothetical protein
MSLIKNKEQYKDDEKIYFILNELEKAHKNKNYFSASVLLKRLENLNFTVEFEEEINVKN